MCCWGGAIVERRRREGRGAEGAEGWGIFLISELKMAHFGAFWLLFFQLSCIYYFTCKKSGIIGLRKLVAVEPNLQSWSARGHGLGLGQQALVL